MYRILCDGYALYDPRDDDLILTGKRCKIGSNICGEASFSILANHPHYDKLKKLKSVFEIEQDGEIIFRGRMTDDSRDFDNMKTVDLEGAMAYLNDSVIRPFSFPKDFPDASSADNVIEYFFEWLINQHNEQVEEFQRFKVGRVTVTDPNNYLSRSSTDYTKSWATIKDKLFGSSLGGYLCIRYEVDGNYLDYLADYIDDNGDKLVNSQSVEFGKNLLDFLVESDGKQTYSAVIPLGSKGSGTTPLTLASLPDDDVTSDIVKDGDTLYSRSAVDAYGWIYAPPEESTFDDITIAANLRTRGVAFLEGYSAGFRDTVTITAMDLHLTDTEVEAFRVYKYVAASSQPHGTSGVYPLSELDVDMDNLQNTKITVGETKGGFVDKTANLAQTVTKIEQTYTTDEKVNQQITQIKTTIEQLEGSITLEVQTQIDGLQDSVSQLIVDTNSITARVEEVNSQLSSTITQTATQIRAEVADEVSGLNSSITQTATKIRSEVADEVDGLESSITQTATQIRSEISDEIDDVNSSITQTANTIRSEISSTAAGLETKITQTVNDITLTASGSGTSSTITLKNGSTTIDSATITITGFVTFTDLSTKGSTTINGGNITTGAIATDRMATNSAGYVAFDAPLTTYGISGLNRLYFGQYSYIYKEDYTTDSTSALCFYSYGGYKFLTNIPKYVRSNTSYDFITAYNIDDYLGDTVAKFG